MHREQIIIKHVQKDDTAILQDLLSHHIDRDDEPADRLDANYLNELLSDNRCYLLAAMISNVVVGYTLAYRFPSLYAKGNMAYLYDIDVLETHRRKGIGSRLIKHVLQLLKQDDVYELWLGTAIDNMEGQALFTATGAARSGEAFNDFTYEL